MLLCHQTGTSSCKRCVLRSSELRMSTSIRKVGVAPLSAFCYPPPEWLIREIETRSWPRRTVRFPEFSTFCSPSRARSAVYSVNPGEQVSDWERRICVPKRSHVGSLP